MSAHRTPDLVLSYIALPAAASGGHRGVGGAALAGVSAAHTPTVIGIPSKAVRSRASTPFCPTVKCRGTLATIESALRRNNKRSLYKSLHRDDQLKSAC